MAAVDFELLLVLFALLVTVEILRASGLLDRIVRTTVARFRTTRSFGIALVAFAGGLATLITNDVARIATRASSAGSRSSMPRFSRGPRPADGSF